MRGLGPVAGILGGLGIIAAVASQDSIQDADLMGDYAPAVRCPNVEMRNQESPCVAEANRVINFPAINEVNLLTRRVRFACNSTLDEEPYQDIDGPVCDVADLILDRCYQCLDEGASPVIELR